MEYRDRYNNVSYGYRDVEHGIDLLGFDFGTPLAIAPGNLNGHYSKALEALVKSSLGADPDRKAVKIIKINDGL